MGAWLDRNRSVHWVDAREIYVNGFSMSLPREVQTDLVHALPGLERL